MGSLGSCNDVGKLVEQSIKEALEAAQSDDYDSGECHEDWDPGTLNTDSDPKLGKACINTRHWRCPPNISDSAIIPRSNRKDPSWRLLSPVYKSIALAQVDQCAGC